MIHQKNLHKRSFIPLEDKKRYHILSSITGFTLVEIMVAAIIITITVAGTFAAYLYARQHSDKFRHRAMAIGGAQAIAEYIRYRLPDGYRNERDLASGTIPYVFNGVFDVDLNELLNPDNAVFVKKVDNLSISYTVTDVHFNNNGVEVIGPDTTDPSRNFKKIIVSVTYDIRKPAV